MARIALHGRGRISAGRQSDLLERAKGANKSAHRVEIQEFLI